MNKKKILSLIMALVMLVGVFSPLTALAKEGETDVKAKHKTVIRIHKIVMPKADMDNHKDEGKSPKYDGTKIQDIESYFTKGKEVKGVAFDVYKELDATEEGAIAHNDPILGGKGVQGKFYKKVNQEKLITTTDGVDTPELEKGAYVIVEDKAASTYVGTDGKTLAESKAIPTRIVLPMTKPDGSGLFGTAENDKLHIYPKNTEEKPQIDKNFDKEANEKVPGITNDDLVSENKDLEVKPGESQRDKSTATKKVGDQVPFKVVTEIPAGTDYKTIRWEDTMTKGLTFDKNLKIQMDGQDFAAGNYTLTQNESGFTLTLNDDGLAAVKEAAKTAKVTFTLKYTATINDSAVVEEADRNNIKLDYSNKKKEFKDPRENEITPKDQKITVTKTWADGDDTTAPKGVTVKYYLYEKGTKADGSDDKVVDSVVKTGTDFNHTFEKLDENKTYYVKEIVSGYKPEYTATKDDGTVAIKNTKDNENPTPLDPTEPEVVTYGKRFVKADQNNGTRLAGAEFVIKNEEGKFLALKETQATEKKAYDNAQKAYIDAINAWNKVVAENNEKEADKKLGDDKIEVTIDGTKITGKTNVESKIAELKKARDDAFKAINTQWKWANTEGEAFKFTSDQEGKFEVTGLAKGTYTLREVKAPAGYALPSNQDVDTFDVADGTYTSHANGVKYEGTENVADGTGEEAQRINNKKVSIPQTGGMGTVLFTIVGISLMAGAVVAMKRNREEA